MILESDHETTQSNPKLKKRKVDQKKGSRAALKASESNNWPSSIEVIHAERSFWDTSFGHSAHGRANNYSVTDSESLAK